MYIDAPILSAGSAILNATVPSGTVHPAEPTTGSLFFHTEVNALQVFIAELGWIEVGAVGRSQLAAELLDVEVNSIPQIRTEITEHLDDVYRHITAPQREILQAAVLEGVTGDDAKKLIGLSGLDGTILENLDSLNRLCVEKVDKSGGTMAADLSMGGNRLTNLGKPMKPSDAATVEYVNTLQQGLFWKKEVKVGTVEDISLHGLQVIDGVQLKVSDRVLVKDQMQKSQNGIWLAATGDWSRAPDANSIEKLDRAAVFVRNGSQAGASFVQSAELTAMNVSTIVFSQIADGHAAANIANLQAQIDELRALISLR